MSVHQKTAMMALASSIERLYDESKTRSEENLGLYWVPPSDPKGLISHLPAVNEFGEAIETLDPGTPFSLYKWP